MASASEATVTLRNSPEFQAAVNDIRAAAADMRQAAWLTFGRGFLGGVTAVLIVLAVRLLAG